MQALSRLSQAQGPYGTIDYSYDGVGNRLSRSIDGNAETYTYAPGSHHLQSVIDGAGSTAYTYDAAGNTLTKGGGERQYSYDPAGRLTEINELGTNAHLGALRYNAHGQRFHATLAQENRREVYHYDQDGRLIVEMDHSGAPVLREYVYLEDVPLAMFARRQASSGGGLLGDLLDPVTGSLLPVEVFYFHTDHLGTPRLLTDANGDVVWQGEYRPFGQVTVITEDVVNPLRFPGQRDDGTSGVYYNYFRDYDPTAGRYIQSDPIGLGGGLSTHGYALQNPILLYDSYGLWVPPKIPPAAADALTGVADSLSFGLGPLARDVLGVDGDINRCSNAYKFGEYGSLALGAGWLLYTGTAKGLPLLIRGGESELDRALQISTARNTLKKTFSINPRRTYKIYTAEQMLEKYKTSDAIVDSATRTSKGWNALGADAAAGGLVNEATNCECW